ncbi:MAG: APC family permease [Hyphomonadaceae bacterium]|nr:APC family permease [Hyphomonadaceae bacterium]
MSERDVAPRRHVSTAYVVMLAVGMVVGAGIFKAPAQVADAAGSEAWLYGVWLAGGLLSLAGALCYSELAAAFPSAGGDYHFLQLAYGKRVAFLFAWGRFAIINSGSIAFLGFVIGDYLNATAPFRLGADGSAIYAAIAVVTLTAFNLRGAYKGAAADYSVTGLEVVGLLMMSAAAIWLALRGVPPLTVAPPAGPGIPAGLGLAMVFVLLAYGGWSEIATLSAEVKDARLGMARAHTISIFAITALYLLVNWAFLRGLGLEGLATSEAPAADLMKRAFGDYAALLLVLAVAFAAITSINATIIVGARTTYAAAQDFPALGALGRWDEGRGIPAAATWAQGFVSLALVGLGAWTRNGFTTIVDYTFPAFWLFLSLSGIALIVLRFTKKDAPRPFRTPLYPFTPIIFVGSCAYMLWSSLMYLASLQNVRIGAFVGIGVLALGVVVMLWLEMRSAKIARQAGT